MAVFPAFFGLLMAALVTGQHVEISPREAVRKVGEQLQVICKVPYAIDSCRVSVGGQFYRLRPGDADDTVVYFGHGLEQGECGVHIKNIREEWNGNITCVLPPQTGSKEIQASMRLYVAKAPKQPYLDAPNVSAFKEGDVFMAMCVAEDGRPAAKISWLLDDEELLAGVYQPNITSLPGSDLQTIRQNISRTVSADDNNRILTCRVEHEALPSPYDIKRQLVVHYPPKRQESGPITIFGLKLNEPGRLNVSVRSNPPPRAEWATGELRLVAPHQTDDGLYAAPEPLHLGGGYYNITLIIARVTKEEVDRTYYLRVDNDLGREEIIVRISTMDEPAGVELETGAIVGIVIAVLVFLIALSLGVFAFVTDRWCFAGRSHRTDIPDGADSEAPLPPHDDVKGSENPSHDHGDYIGNGDTKHPEKKPDTAV